jgi:serine/threonine protein kinase/tetratricopeptide (TPR) repeat protein
MGQVFEAADTHLFDRRVAVKILHQNLSGTETLRKRFQAEARISALLGQHPLIVKVTDYGLYNDQPYIVMEFLGASPIVGKPLDEVINSGPLELRRSIRLARQMCSAFQYAHAFVAEQTDCTISGVIHRDIKPSNIFILRDDTMGETVKVLDFGVAKTISDVTMALGTQMGFIGTPAYAPPEQMRGDPLDFRADIYSLGVVIYEMVTGELPLIPKTESFPGWYEAQNYQQPRPMDPQQVPPSLAEVIMSCLEKDPERRPSSMGELRTLLKGAMQRSLSHLNRQQTASRRQRDPDLHQLVRPLEVALASHNVSPHFRLRQRDLHILLEYPASTPLDRPALLDTITTLLQQRRPHTLDQAIVYGRPFHHSRPEWQETLRFDRLETLIPQLATVTAAAELPLQSEDEDPVLPVDSLEEWLEPSSEVEAAAQLAVLPLAGVQAEVLPLATEKQLLSAPSQTNTRVHLPLANLDQSSQLPHLESEVNLYGRLQWRALLASLPSLSDRIQQVQDWYLEQGDSLLQSILPVELNRSIIDIDPDAMVAYQAGWDALMERSLQLALTQFHYALDVDATFAEAQIGLGVTYAQQGYQEQALIALQSALNLDSSCAEAHAYLGDLYLERQEVDKGIQLFQQALNIQPRLIPAHHQLLKALVKQGQLDEAIQHYLNSLQQVPQLINLRAPMSQIILLHVHDLLQNGRGSDAALLLKKAVGFNSNDPLLHCYLGFALTVSCSRHDWQDALTEFRIASRLQPSWLEVQLGMGIVYHRLHNFKAALNCYRSALELNAQHRAGRYLLAMTLYRQGELQAALVELRTVLDKDPEFSEGRVSWGLALLQAGELDQALHVFEMILSQGGNAVAEAHVGKGSVLLARGLATAAQGCFQSALELQPMLAVAHAGIGLSYLYRSPVLELPPEWELAKSKLEMALQITPDTPEAFLGLGLLERMRHNLIAAVEHYRSALRGNLSYTEAHYLLGLSLAEQGLLEEALVEIQTAVHLNPRHHEASNLLQSLQK